MCVIDVTKKTQTILVFEEVEEMSGVISLVDWTLSF